MATASLVPTSNFFPVSLKCQATIKTRTGVIVASWQRQQRRRELLLKSAVAIPTILQLKEAPISEAREVEVGSYLPPSPSDSSFVLFKAKPSDTPALRAGNVQPYQFVLPPNWKQLRIANILSGNYCQPKCAEPWIEVKFENEKQGKVQVVASPLIRLTNKPNATIEDIGEPEKVIASLGPFVTGNSYDSDELLETSVERIGDQTYYKYVLETPYALTGSHNLAKATAKGNTVVLFVVSATEKQWQSSRKTLQAILDSFQLASKVVMKGGTSGCGRTQEYVTYFTPSTSTTMKTRDSDFVPPITSSMSPSLPSLGSTSTDTTINRVGLVSWKVSSLELL